MKLDRVFVDTSAWVAIVNRREGVHSLAVDTYTRLLADGTPLLTTLPVLTETYALLRIRLGYDIAYRFLQNVNTTH